ncbi:CFAP47, partial [Symbiodinium sp. KB8]
MGPARSGEDPFVRVGSPEPEGSLSLTAVAQQEAQVLVPLHNPAESDTEFLVALEGAHLSGPSSLTVPAGSTVNYTLKYAPLAPGSGSGTLAFTSPATGEFWYDLKLVATEPQDEVLPEMSVPVGQVGTHQVEVQNPSASPVTVTLLSSAPRLVTVSPEAVLLPPHATKPVTLTYTPGSVGEVEEAVVTASAPGLGSWRYILHGQGAPPGVHPTTTTITAPAGASASASVAFRNPFPKPLKVLLTLRSGAPDEDERRGGAAAAARVAPPLPTGSTVVGLDAEGTLPPPDAAGHFKLLRKTTAVVPPLAFLQVPLAFEPSVISQSTATLLVKSAGDSLVWQFPLRGVGEAVGRRKPIAFSGKARSRASKEVELPLVGLPTSAVGEPFSVRAEAVDPQDAAWLANTVRLTCLNKGSAVSAPGEPLLVRVELEALKPARVPARLLVAKASGGQWAFEAVFEATAPDPDDTITIEAGLGKLGAVSFALTNQLPEPAPFRARLTLDSSPEFSVSPASGELAGQGSQGTVFTVTFAPTEYGKPCRARLVVDTPDMQWSYEVVGQPPEYVAPRAARGRVDTQLRGTAASALAASRTRGTPKDFVRGNMNVKGPYKPSHFPVTASGELNLTPFFSPGWSIQTYIDLIESATPYSTLDIATPGFDSWTECTHRVDDDMYGQCTGCKPYKAAEETFPVFPALLNAVHGKAVKVRLLTNDYGTPTCEGYIAPLDYLALNGIEIRYYTSTTFMHAKYIHVNGNTTAVSSVNFSFTSFNLNREAGLI